MSQDSNWSFDRIRAKLEKGQFLSDVEKAYLEDHVSEFAHPTFDKFKSRGPHFKRMLAERLLKMADAEMAKSGFQQPGDSEQEPELSPVQRALKEEAERDAKRGPYHELFGSRD